MCKKGALFLAHVHVQKNYRPRCRLGPHRARLLRTHPEPRMPILTDTEFANHVGEKLADQLVDAPSTFAAAEAGAAQKVAGITGIDVPSDATDAPEWAKQPTAFLVMHALSGQINWSEERRQWAREARSDALEELHRQAERRADGPEDSASPTVDAISGLTCF